MKCLWCFLFGHNWIAVGYDKKRKTYAGFVCIRCFEYSINSLEGEKNG